MSDTQANKEEVDVLLDELRAIPKDVKAVSAKTFTLSSEDLKQFLLDQAGQLIQNSIQCVNGYRDYLGMSPGEKEVQSLAELIKASSAAIESLNKLYIQDERSKSAEKVERIRSEAKMLENGAGGALKITMSRKELMDAIFKKTKAIDDGPVIDVK